MCALDIFQFVRHLFFAQDLFGFVDTVFRTDEQQSRFGKDDRIPFGHGDKFAVFESDTDDGDVGDITQACLPYLFENDP